METNDDHALYLPPPPSELKIAQIVAFALLTALGASQVQAQGAAFPDPQPAGATTLVSVNGNRLINSDCSTPTLSITAPAETILTVVQGAPVAARTFVLGTISQGESCNLIDYRVDALGAGNDLKIGQTAARDYMGLTLRLGGRKDFDFGDDPPLENGSLTARLGSDTSNVFEDGFGNGVGSTPSERRAHKIRSFGLAPVLELELSPAPGIFTEGSVSRVQAGCDNSNIVSSSCAVASQVFELRVIPALSDVAFAAFNDAADTPLNPYIATGASMLSFKLALPDNPYEVTYEMASAEVIAGANPGTTLTVSLPNTLNGMVDVTLPAELNKGDIIAISARAVVQAEATHERLSGQRFFVTVVEMEDSSNINDDNSLDEIVVAAPHRVLPGVYALAAGSTQSARISNPTAVIPGASTPTDHIAEAGVFNFTVTGLTEASSRADVVITLETTLTTTAMPHKYAMATDTTTATWNVFDTSEGDAWYGAVMTGDACPAADSDTWKPEVLAAGDQCLRVTLTDGGMNDADGVRNGVIHDPIALVGTASANAKPGGGGAMHWLWLLAALLPLAMPFGARGRSFKNSE